MRTLIRGGTVVTATETTDADVVIEDEKVAAIGRGMAVEADVLLETRRLYEWVLEPLYSLRGRVH